MDNRPLRKCSLLVAALCGCGAPPASIGGGDGPLVAQARSAAVEAGAPLDLMLAIARVEGGLALGRFRTVDPEDHVPVAGILELRHGRFDSLARGAALLGTSEDALRADTDLGTRAGALVLAELANKMGAPLADPRNWRAVTGALSGLAEGPARDAYLHDVFTTLKSGGRFAARGGEWVTIAPHPELPAEVDVLSEALGGPPADFPPAMWLSTDCNANGGKCTAGRPDGNGSVNSIVIHDTEGGWNASVATLQFDGGKSVHYLIDSDGGRVAQFLHEGDTAWHAGNWCWNKHSIGIEHVGVAADPNGYSDGLYHRSVELVQNIRSRWNVPLDRAHIVGHYQIPNGSKIAECSPACADTLDGCEKSANYGGSANHRDPGYYWQWCQYFQWLGGHCECNDAWPLWNCTSDKTEAVRCNNGNVEIQACSPCESQPLGKDDICHQPPPPPMDMAVATPPADLAVTAPGEDAGARAGDDLATGNPGGDDDGGSGGATEFRGVQVSGGCAVGPLRRTDGATWLIVMGALAAMLGARRRR